MNDTFISLFQSPPFDFQSKVAKHLLAGKSVILRAPTGAGKTRAALFPFLYAWNMKAAFPRQMIYSLPLRTLATSLYDETQKLCRKVCPDIKVTIQTGEQPDDPQLREGDIIFATYDQSLSSFLTIPVGLSRREGNINAGAMIASYLVFDEFHLMEASRSLTTMATMLKWLKHTPFLLMTATLSEAMAETLAKQVGAEIVTMAEADLSKIPSQNNKKRKYQVKQGLLIAADVLATHQHRSLAVCNTVDRAQFLYAQIKDAVANSGASHKVILLHSRFLPDDRREIENKIRIIFGKDADPNQDAILVATQVIEVGLDLTCEHLHTEIAPAAAIIQRAGRCARFPGEEGIVHIYDVPENENGEKSYLPYDGKGEPALCPPTWKALLSPEIANSNVGFPQEQALIEIVYSAVDKLALDEGSIRSRRSDIAGLNGVLTTQDRAEYRNLIRFVDSRTFFVHSSPEDIEDPLQMQTFNVSPGTLAHRWKEFNRYHIDQEEWFACLVATDKKEDDEQAQRYIPPKYHYPHVYEDKQIYSEYFFVINPKYVDYSPEMGLRFMTGGQPPSVLTKVRPGRENFVSVYHLETYQEHIERVWAAYERLFGCKGRFDYVTERLLQSYDVSFKKLIQATIAAHDIGKLDHDWQRWIQIWQHDYKHIPTDPKQFYAHTDYNGDQDKKKQSNLNAKFSRPPHAAEGAQAISSVLCELFSMTLAMAVYSAIVRHHSPGANKVHPYKISGQARTEAMRVFALVTDKSWKEEWTPLLSADAQGRLEESVAENLTKPDGMVTDDFLIYLLLVRALRISDQQSLAENHEQEA